MVTIITRSEIPLKTSFGGNAQDNSSQFQTACVPKQEKPHHSRHSASFGWRSLAQQVGIRRSAQASPPPLDFQSSRGAFFPRSNQARFR